ncbi:MAG: pentapeptide repeat-containing protein [Desertimonas sp.]
MIAMTFVAIGALNDALALQLALGPRGFGALVVGLVTCIGGVAIAASRRQNPGPVSAWAATTLLVGAAYGLTALPAVWDVWRRENAPTVVVPPPAAITATGATISNQQWVGLNLRNSTITSTLLQNVSFRDSDLSESDFRGSTLVDVNVSGADLCGVDLRGADLSRVIGISDVRRFDYVFFDELTLWPEGFMPDTVEGTVLVGTRSQLYMCSPGRTHLLSAGDG